MSLWELKAQRDESSGRILMGDNNGGEAMVLRAIRFQCDGFCILTELSFIENIHVNLTTCILNSHYRKILLAPDF